MVNDSWIAWSITKRHLVLRILQMIVLSEFHVSHPVGVWILDSGRMLSKLHGT